VGGVLSGWCSGDIVQCVCVGVGFKLSVAFFAVIIMGGKEVIL
jgi:hypothetical protein